MRPVDPRLLRQAAPARGLLGVSIFASLVLAGLVLVQAALLARGIAHAGAGWTALRGTLGVLALVFIGRTAATYLTDVTALRAAGRVRGQLRGRMLAALARNPHDLGGRGALLVTATHGLESIDGYFARFLPQLVLSMVVPAAVVVTVARSDLISALVIVSTLPLIPIFMVLVGLHTRARTERQWRALTRLGGHFLDVVQGLPTLVAFRRADAQVTEIRRVSEQHRQATMATLRLAFLSALVLELLATLATALVAVEVGLRLLAGHLPYQTALFVLLLAPEAYLPLRALGAQFHASTDGATAVTHALDVIDNADGLRSGGAATVDLRRDRIELRDVVVAAPGRASNAIEGIDLSIEPGEHLALVGPSGAGKSTLLGLLLGLRSVDAGVVTIGGVGLDDVDLDSLRAQIAWVPQSPHLFSGTVADNIRLGAARATASEVARAAARAGLDVSLDRDVGERGLSLSSGQRQRVALARALLRDVPMLLLDEPTAHVDDDTAADIRARVRRWSAGRTTVVVGHGHSWDCEADRIVRLAGGRLQPGLAVVA